MSFIAHGVFSAFNSMVRFFSATLRNPTAMKMNNNEIQSCILGYFAPKSIAESNVAVVPATNDVRRFTNPAKVAVLPLNIKRNTEKNATTPNAVPLITPQNHTVFGRTNAL